MLTIILGAGASHDSAPVNSYGAKGNPWQPPLTKDIFLASQVWCVRQDTVKFPDHLIPILDRIRRESSQVGVSMESVLEALRSEMDSNPRRWPQLLAIQDWLCQVLTHCTDEWIRPLAGATTLVDLAERLHDWRLQVNEPINFITFNYDLLLEKAVDKCQIRPFNADGFDRYIRDEFNIFKPHGSVNWSYTVRFDTERNNISDRPLSEAEKHSLILNCRAVAPLSKRTTSMVNGVTSGELNALAIPVVSKSHDDFIFPPGHKEKFFQTLNSTTAMLVIGWAAAEQHFMQEVATRVRHDIPVLIVCGKGGGAATISSLKVAGKLTNIVDSDSGFADFLNTAELEDWLGKSAG